MLRIRLSPLLVCALLLWSLLAASASAAPGSLGVSTPQILARAAGAELSAPMLVKTPPTGLMALWGRGNTLVTAILASGTEQWVQGPSLTASDASGASVASIATHVTPEHTLAVVWTMDNGRLYASELTASQQWTAPVSFLVTSQCCLGGLRLGASPDGTLIASADFRPDNGLGQLSGIVVERSKSGRWRRPLGVSGYAQAYRGGVAAVWPKGGAIELARRTRRGWSRRQTLGRGTLANVIVDQSGTAAVLIGHDPNDVRLAVARSSRTVSVSQLPGTMPLNASNPAAVDANVHLASDGHGTVFASWLYDPVPTRTDARVLVSSSGGGFQLHGLGSAALSAGFPAPTVVLSTAQNATVFWEGSSGGHGVLLAATHAASGSWTSARSVLAEPGASDELVSCCTITPDGVGGLVVFWDTYTIGSAPPGQSMLPVLGDTLYARTLSTRSPWSATAPLVSNGPLGPAADGLLAAYGLVGGLGGPLGHGAYLLAEAQGRFLFRAAGSDPWSTVHLELPTEGLIAGGDVSLRPDGSIAAAWTTTDASSAPLSGPDSAVFGAVLKPGP